MTDAAIRACDVAIDLVERGKVLVVEQAAKTVADHQQREDYDIQSYKGNALLNVSDDETVWTVVYLSDKPTTEFSGGYDFPESRLARIPVENARESFRRPQEAQAVSMLEAMFKMAATLDSEWSVEPEDFQEALVVLTSNMGGLRDELVDEAIELADVEQTIAAEGDD